MKKNPKLELIRKRIPADVRLMIDHSFAVVDRIDKIMIQKGISQKELADRLGKRESEISKWMRGTHNFTFKTIAKLEVALQAPILLLAPNKTSVFIMSITSGSSVIHASVSGSKQHLNDSGNIYVKANESNTIAYDLMEQLN